MNITIVSGSPRKNSITFRMALFLKKVLEEITEQIKKISDDENIVIDTTGSVMYMKKNVLKKLCLIISFKGKPSFRIKNKST